MTIRHQPDDRTHETEAIRRLTEIARARGWRIDIEPTTRFAARLTTPAGVRHVLIGADLGLNTSAARRVAEDKAFAAHFLAIDGLPTIPTFPIADRAHAASVIAANHLSYPIVIKPNRAHEARGLTFVNAEAEIPAAIEHARAIDPIVILQPRIARAEFRILFHVEHVATFEKRTGAPNAPANLAAGATWIDRTNDTAPEHVDLARRALRSLGLTFAGVDVFAADIGAPDARVAILEVNATPGLKALAMVPGALDRLLMGVADRLDRAAPPPEPA